MSDPALTSAVAVPPPTEPPTPRPPRRLGRWLVAAGTLMLVLLGLAAWRYAVTRPEYRLRAGRRAIAAGDYYRAWELAESLEAAGDPDRADLLRGEALLARGEYNLALERFNLVRDGSDLRVRAAFHSGRCLVELKQMGEAFRVLSWALQQDPDDADGHRAMAAVAYDLGQMGQARRHLAEVSRLAPDDGKPYRLLGLIDKDSSDFASARTAYRKALERELPAAFRREITLELAVMAHEEKKPAEVLRELDALAALGGEAPGLAASLRAAALLRQSKPSEARAVVAKALERHPDEAELWAVKGEIELNVDRDAKKAVPTLEKAARLAPADYRVAYLLGQAYSGTGRVAEAKQVNAKADSLRDKMNQIDKLSREAMARPWDAEVRLQLSQLWADLGNSKLSAMWYRAAEACRQM